MRQILSYVVVTVLLAFAVAEFGVVPPEEYRLYDTGEYGRVPTSKLKSTNGGASRLHRRVWSEQCDRPDQYHFIAPHGILLGHSGPEIIDNDGNQVWFGRGFRTTYNFRAQWYQGQQYLTWWTGNDQVRGHGSGYYYMLDKHYRLYKKVAAIGENMMGDLHEFIITNDNTAILTVYDTIPWNLTDWGIADEEGWGYIRDGVFQEIDLETNELLFQWRASEHITVEECYSKPSGEGKTFDNAWDWFHINSVQKDGKGNYLVSSRYAHALFYINGKTGNIIWYLGGMKNSFKDLSGGRATDIARQHHATWADNQASIIVFDNGEKKGKDDFASRGLKVAVDQNAMTVKVLAEAYHPMGYFSASQGSIQQLDNGNLLVGWGYAPAFTEFSPDGKQVICDTQFAGLHTDANGSFTPGAAESYRAFKGPWQGFPLDDPEIAFAKDGRLYVSWNGATELRYWVLEGTDGLGTHAEDWTVVASFPRTGFESNATVNAFAYRTFRLTALDKNSASLGSWVVLSSGDVQRIPILAPPPATSSIIWTIFIFCLGAIGAIAAIHLRHSKAVRRSWAGLPTSKDGKSYSLARTGDDESLWSLWHRLRRRLGALKIRKSRGGSDEWEHEWEAERRGLVVGDEKDGSDRE